MDFNSDTQTTVVTLRYGKTLTVLSPLDWSTHHTHLSTDRHRLTKTQTRIRSLLQLGTAWDSHGPRDTLVDILRTTVVEIRCAI
jgi:hypothetical protein